MQEINDWFYIIDMRTYVFLLLEAISYPLPFTLAAARHVEDAETVISW
jgi:hypothetical protein